MNVEIPTAFSQNGESLAFADIQHTFKQSSYGEKLLHSIRWGPYKPLDYTNAQWERLVGVDANNFKHIQLTYGLTRAFIRYNDPTMFTKDEQIMLLLSATIHDWGEAINGDVIAPLKTSALEEEEFIQLLRIASDIGIQGTLAGAIRTSVTEVLHPDVPTKLSQAFHAIEVQGYHRTSLRAWEKLHGDVSDEDRDNALAAMIISVHSKHVPLLVDIAQTYPAIQLHLRQNAKDISTIFHSFSDANVVFLTHIFQPNLTPEKIITKWNRAKNAWLKTGIRG